MINTNETKTKHQNVSIRVNEVHNELHGVHFLYPNAWLRTKVFFFTPDKPLGQMMMTLIKKTQRNKWTLKCNRNWIITQNFNGGSLLLFGFNRVRYTCSYPLCLNSIFGMIIKTFVVYKQLNKHHKNVYLIFFPKKSLYTSDFQATTKTTRSNLQYRRQKRLSVYYWFLQMSHIPPKEKREEEEKYEMNTKKTSTMTMRLLSNVYSLCFSFICIWHNSHGKKWG